MHFGFRSVYAAYGRLTAKQYALVARIWNGEDVRYYSPFVHPNVARSLIERAVLDCEAATCRLLLLPPANAVRAA